MPKSRSKDFIKGELRRIAKNELATIRQKLDALIWLAMIDGIYKPSRMLVRMPTPPQTPPIPQVIVGSDEEGDELLRQFNEQHYNGGNNAGSNT